MNLPCLRRPRAVYVHVPFCRHRCGYCDFTLIAGRDDLIDRYLSAMNVEVSRSETGFNVRQGRESIDTLSFGGGTPTHLSPGQFQRLFEILQRRFDFSGAMEISVEANPLDVTDAMLDALVECGVNRLSLGVQSFHARELQLLERDHQAADIVNVVRRARRRIPNLSLDLIFGVPGQSLDEWRENLRRAIDLGVEHLSTYGLTFEDGTAFQTRRQRGELSPISNDDEAAMYELTIDVLADARFEHYEISNFARTTFRSRHNLTYWNGDPYYGFGPGAARYVNGERATNNRSVLGWIADLEAGRCPVRERETLEAEPRAREFLIMALRRLEGVGRGEFAERTGLNLDAIAQAELARLVQHGWLIDDGRTIRLTRAGLLMANRVFVELV